MNSATTPALAGLASHPGILQRSPPRHIAAYPGIAPEIPSRIRAAQLG